MIPCFGEGRFGELKEPGKIRGTKSSEPFRNIALSRGTCIADLIAEFEIARCWSSGSKFKDLALQLAAQLPRHEILKVPRARTHTTWPSTSCASTPSTISVFVV